MVIEPRLRRHALLETFAHQVAIAIENVRLFEAERQRTRELSESLEQQTATSEVLKVISSSPGELDQVFQAILQNAVRICKATFGNLYLREDDGFRAAAMYNAPRATPRSALASFIQARIQQFGRRQGLSEQRRPQT
jgi:hypothetical protein